MKKQTISSLSLHLEYPEGAVLPVKKLQDVGCGIYPVYYVRQNDHVLVSTSVTELIFELGDFRRNNSFNPPEFLESTPIGDKLELFLPSRVRENVPSSFASWLRTVGFLSSTYWYENPQTVDQRIEILQPFEEVTSHGTEQTFDPTYSLSHPEKFVNRSVDYITDFVNDIERRFPDHEHIIRMGGKDSQLIALVPKISENWSVFSAEPNYQLVNQFIQENGISVNQLYHHDNQNEESRDEFCQKIICSDLRSDPRHLRWYPTLQKIVDEHDGDVIFWCGTEGDTIYSYHVDFSSVSKEEYFDLHFERAANWQAITHQVTKNYTGAPAISPYHSPSIWEDLYQHYDPRMISKGDDLRPQLGEQLYGGDVWWPDRNPSPNPYSYDWTSKVEPMYVEYIKRNI